MIPQKIIIILIFLTLKMTCRKTLYIPGVTLNTHLDQSLTELPFESPTLIVNDLSSLNLNLPSENIILVNSFFQKFNNIIGYLPPIEQTALIYSINSDTYDTVFNQTKYNSFMNERIGENKLSRFQIVQNSLLDYAKKNQLRIPIGLGCIQKVAEEYGTKNPKENNELLESITNSIDKILNAQINLIEKENIFILDFLEQLHRKKRVFFEIKYSDLEYILDDKGTFLSLDPQLKMIKYSNDFDVNSLLEYMKERNKFNKILSKESLLSQANLALMEGCMYTGENNEDAGISSYSGTPDRIKKRGEFVSHNLANGTRFDSRTQNNYFLNFGFGFGTQRKSGISPYKNLIPYKSYQYINQLSTLATNMNTQNSSFITIALNISNIINNINQYDKQMNYLIDDVSNSIKSSRINYDIYISPSLNQGESKAWSIDCDSNGCRNFTTNGNFFENLTMELSGYSEYHLVFGEYMSQTFYVSYAVNSNGELIYEIYYNGRNVFSKEKEFSETSNSCFGVFFSGGKNDKDTCRNVLKEECGNEIDYRCKESGFYDVMTENPISLFDYPLDCEDQTSNKCIEWVDRHIIGGGIVLKPSSLMSLSLLIQKFGTIEDSNLKSVTGPDYFYEMNFEKGNYNVLGKSDLNVALKKTVFYQVNSFRKIKVFWSLIIFFVGVLI